MLKVSIGYKIFIGFFIVIILSASFLLISYPSLTKINILSSQTLPLSAEVETLQQYNEKTRDLQSKIELYILIGSQEIEEELALTVKQTDQLIAVVRENKDMARLYNISNLMARLTGSITVLLDHAENDVAAYQINKQIITINELFKKFQQAQLDLQGQRLAQLQKNVIHQNEIVTRVMSRFFVIEISIILFGFLASFLLAKLITKKLSKLRRATQQIASGNFNTRINIRSQDEIGLLASSFNSMTENLERTTVSKEYVDSIISSMAEALVVVDSDLKINRVNEAVCGLLGYQEAELLGEPIEKIFSVQGKAAQLQELKEGIKEGRLKGHEAYCRSRVGKDIPVLLSVAAMQAESFEGSRIVCTMYDITERKVVEEKIKEISEMKSRLTSTVSHELRTPMAAIKLGIDIVLNRLAGDINPEQEQFLGRVRKNVDRLARLINNVLDFQKLEAGKMELQVVKADLNAAAKEIHEVMNNLAKEKGLKFTLSLSKKLPKVKFDRDRIIQVISNLVHNAIKFTDQGTIKISSKLTPQGACISVSDSGIGIKKDDISKVFHSFEQLKRLTGAGGGGTGLGLAICKDIIEMHGGKIWVDSNFNKGSTFYFILPI